MFIFIIIIITSFSGLFFLSFSFKKTKKEACFSLSLFQLSPISYLQYFPNPLLKPNSLPKIEITTVTAYYPSPKDTDSTPCISASGLNICKAKTPIVACPRKYPFGTKVLINGKIYTCEDRTNIKYDGIFDILMKNKKEVVNWGKKILPVIVFD